MACKFIRLPAPRSPCHYVLARQAGGAISFEEKPFPSPYPPSLDRQEVVPSGQPSPGLVAARSRLKPGQRWGMFPLFLKTKSVKPCFLGGFETYA